MSRPAVKNALQPILERRLALEKAEIAALLQTLHWTGDLDQAKITAHKLIQAITRWQEIKSILSAQL